MISGIKISFSFLLILFITSSFSQSKFGKFGILSTNDGLSHNSGLCLLRDQKGFLWIGTQNGLCRYDGYSIKKFLHAPGVSNSLSGNYINSIFEDKSGTIWVGTNQGGINKFNPVDESFTSYHNNPNDPNSLGFGSIYSINEDRFGNLWVAVNPTGLFLFDKKNNKFYHFGENTNEKLGYRGHRTFCLFKDSEKNLWIGTDRGINELVISKKKNASDSVDIINRYGFTFKNQRHDPQNKNSLVNDVINSIEEDKTGSNKTLWIGTDDGLSKMILGKNGKTTFTNYNHDYHNPNSISSDIVWSIRKDNKGKLWVGTKNGINLFDYENNNFNKNIYIPAKENAANYTVRCILEDRSGVLWFGTEDIAVLKLLNDKKNFRVYSHNPANKNSLSDNNITSVLEDRDNNLWVGTKYGGLDLLRSKERKTGKFVHFVNDPLNKQSLLHNHVRSIFQDREGTIWIGSWNANGGLNQFSPGTNSFIHYQHNPSDPNSLSDNQVKNIMEDSEGNLWIALSETGLDMFDKKSKKFTHFYHDPDKPNSISDNSVINIYNDGEGYLWISTFNGGLNKLDLKTKKFTHYKFDPGNEYCISSNRVWVSYKDRSGRFWVGTDNGINFFDPITEKFVSFDETDGLINKSVYGILEDEHKSLWLSTQNGISKMEVLPFVDGLPNKIRFTNYDSEDNPAITEFNSNAFLKSRSGEFYFGGVDGLVHFYPDSIKNNTNVPKVVVTSFKIFEKEAILDTSITLKKSIVIPYSDNFFSFEFAALDFQSPDRNQFAYQLEGFNNNWVNSGNRRFVSFSHLDPGKYIFRVKASNNDGLWNEAGTSVAVFITPPFWLTTWFKLLSAVIALTLLTFTLRFIFTRKYKRKIRELAVQQKIQNERERISRELHDNIGANLTSIITGLEISKKYSDKDDKDNLTENISSLEKHTRSTIDELRQTIWSLNNDVETISDLNEKIKEYTLHNIKLDDNPKVLFHFSGNENTHISSTEALNLFRIIQEAVNNAVKYASCAVIEIHLEAKENEIVIRVIDNGKGFDPHNVQSRKGGFGLPNMKKRAEQVNAVFRITSKSNAGTTIEIIKNINTD